MNINTLLIAQTATFGLLLALVVCWPLAKIAGRVGFSRWWAVLALVPIVNLVLVYVFAFAKWPTDGAVERSE